MRIIALAILCLAASAGWADSSGDTVKVYTLTVKERMQNLELINVTAEKPAAENAEPLEAELQAILDEVAELEAEPQS